MNILSIAVACILVFYLYQASRPLKRQKGGNKGVVIALVVLLLAGGGVGAYFLLKDHPSPTPSPTPSPSPVGPPVSPSVCPSVSPSVSPSVGSRYCLDQMENVNNSCCSQPGHQCNAGVPPVGACICDCKQNLQLLKDNCHDYMGSALVDSALQPFLESCHLN